MRTYNSIRYKVFSKHLLLLMVRKNQTKIAKITFPLGKRKYVESINLKNKVRIIITNTSSKITPSSYFFVHPTIGFLE